MAGKVIKELKPELTSADVLNAIAEDTTNPELQAMPRALVKGVNSATNGTSREISMEESIASLNAIGEYIMGSPSAKNAFLTELWNRIGRTIYEGYSYQNKLAKLEKGELPFGWSIQDIFVQLASPYDYKMTEAQGTDAEAIFKAYPPDVRAAYYHINYRKNYRTSTFDTELKQAFTSYDGVNRLVTMIVQRMYDAMRWDEELAGRYVISRCIVDGNVGVVSVPPINRGTGTEVTTIIKHVSLDLDNFSTENNRAAVLTQTPVTEQILLVTNKYDSAYTVEVQSAAFNLDKVEYLAKKMTIRSFSFTPDEVKRLNELFKGDESYRQFTNDELKNLELVNAIIMDVKFPQFYRNYESFYSEYDGLHLKTNHFLHIWKLYATSPFSNAKAFVSSTQGITSVTVAPTSVSVQKGQYAQLTAFVETVGFASKSVVWEIMEATNQSFVSETGVVSIGMNETFDTLTVKCTSAVDITKFATATVTVLS